MGQELGHWDCLGLRLGGLQWGQRGQQRQQGLPCPSGLAPAWGPAQPGEGQGQAQPAREEPARELP